MVRRDGMGMTADGKVGLYEILRVSVSPNSW
jgi:hypothetical protein